MDNMASFRLSGISDKNRCYFNTIDKTMISSLIIELSIIIV